MLPDIERQERPHALVNERRVGIVERRDLEAIPVEHQPGPTIGEVANRLLLQFGEELVGRTEGVVDHLRQASGRPLPLRRGEALPVKAVVPDLGAVVEQAFVALLLRSEEHTSELQSLMRISYAVFCLNKKKTHQMKLEH